MLEVGEAFGEETPGILASSFGQAVAGFARLKEVLLSELGESEGYRPFLTRDGSTLYFAQSERSIQGGLSFSF